MPYIITRGRSICMSQRKIKLMIRRNVEPEDAAIRSIRYVPNENFVRRFQYQSRYTRYFKLTIRNECSYEISSDSGEVQKMTGHIANRDAVSKYRMITSSSAFLVSWYLCCVAQRNIRCTVICGTKTTRFFSVC
jgi:hypothetical protein